MNLESEWIRIFLLRNFVLNIFVWYLTPSHLHLIANTKIPFDLDLVVRDFKRPKNKNHAIELFTEKVTWKILRYIHRNPIIDKIVYNEQAYLPDNYRDSSARNYYGLSKTTD